MTVPETSRRWSPRASLTAIVVGLLTIGLGYVSLMRGLEASWPIALRAVSFVALFEGLGILFAGLHRFTSLGTWVSDQGRSFERFALALPIVAIAMLGVPMYVASVFGVDARRGGLVAIGLASIATAIGRPWWFWYQPEIVALRGLLGDWVVRALYLAVGVSLTGLALFASMSP